MWGAPWGMEHLLCPCLLCPSELHQAQGRLPSHLRCGQRDGADHYCDRNIGVETVELSIEMQLCVEMGILVSLMQVFSSQRRNNFKVKVCAIHNTLWHQCSVLIKQRRVQQGRNLQLQPKRLDQRPGAFSRHSVAAPCCLSFLSPLTPGVSHLRASPEPNCMIHCPHSLH